jgi:hypothetical protein
MATKNIQLTNILDRYIDEVDSEPTALDDVVDWALTQGLYKPEPRDIRKVFKEALAESLRQEKRFDGKRWYRAKRSVRTNIGGVQLNLWADVDKNASFGFMEKSVGQSRRAMVDDAYQLKMVVDHYNEANPGQKQIQLILDLTEDVAEMEAGGNPEEDGMAA